MRSHGFQLQHEVLFRQLEKLWERMRVGRAWKKCSTGIKVAFLLKKGYTNSAEGNVWMMAELCLAQGGGLPLRILWGASPMPHPHPLLLSTEDAGNEA